MKHRSVILAAGVAVAVGGIVFFAVSIYRSTAVPSHPAHPQYTNPEAAAALENAKQFLTPLTPQDRADIPRQLTEAARPASPSQREIALLELFRKRMALMVDPDYDRYIDHIAELTGRSAGTIRTELGDAYRARWESTARMLREASYGTDGCEILTGERDLIRLGGRMISRRDPGVYGSESLLARESAELVQIRLPIIISASFDGEAKTMLLYLVMAFVWNDARSDWVPYVTGLYDPGDQESPIPGPWI
jgi:hypothetical protein